MIDVAASMSLSSLWSSVISFEVPLPIIPAGRGVVACIRAWWTITEVAGGPTELETVGRES